MEIYEIIALVLTAVIAVLGTFFGVKYQAIKSLITMIGEALKDDTITKDEVKMIYEQAKKIIG